MDAKVPGAKSRGWFGTGMIVPSLPGMTWLPGRRYRHAQHIALRRGSQKA